MTAQLKDYYKLHRRYFRSINLERDLEKPDALQGYILTERSASALERILTALTQADAHHAHTLTSVYGTGKSAFAHYLACLCAPQQSELFQAARTIAHEALGIESTVAEAIDHLPNQGLLVAVATGRGEPLTWTIARALAEGAQRFWKGRRRPKIVPKLIDWQIEIEDGECDITDAALLQALKTLRSKAESDIVLILDELGKNLEFAARNRGKADLYLLQQITELQAQDDHHVHFLGVLHHSFRGYSDRLSASEQSEWSKIQGRFTDIPFQDSPSQMTRLIGRALDRGNAEAIACRVGNLAQEWAASLADLLTTQDLPTRVLAETYPLHPIAALVLPELCVRYAQNDRSLFTFLTSDEPYGLPDFLATTSLEGDRLPTLKLHQLYDYFVESVTGLASRLNLQRWVEVQSLIQDARDQSPETLQVLKTIGVLNLVTSTGMLRATRELVALALCDRPDPAERDQWQQLITELNEQRGLITYRKQADELRIWQGSDFNVEKAIADRLQEERLHLADLLKAVNPLKPLVAQRHYTQTGTLRYFEQRYLDDRQDLAALSCTVPSHDGLIVHWVDPESPDAVPELTADGKPLIVITTGLRELLQARSQELEALTHIQKNAPELQTDGVARREVRQRLVEAERRLNETVMQAFNWSTGENRCWIAGQVVAIRRARQFQARLSDLCDRTYPNGIQLSSEFINRRVLTTQGSKARRMLIEAMLDAAEQPRLGLEGYGPEVAVYYSVLGATQIHQETAEGWQFAPPPEESGLWNLWAAVEDFCSSAQNEQQSLDKLYATLGQPPYGVKAGAIPVVLVAVLLYRSDDVGLYKDGTFIPVLGPEHFELLVKDPGRFAVKYFAIAGLRLNVFRDLEKMLRSPTAKVPVGVRNTSLLMVAKPLFSFAKKLPKFTRQTQRISSEAQAVLRELQNAQEPDDLLFTALPQACGFDPIQPDASEDNAAVAEAFGQQFRTCLQEIHQAYDVLLSDAQTRLYQAFGIRSEATKLREDLRVRATYLLNACIEPLLRRFVKAAVDGERSDAEWLESVVMVVADKPPRSWTDQDITAYELALKDISQRFKHLEVLQRTQELKSPDAEPYLITTTRSSGEEVSRVAWVDRADEHEIDQFVERVLADEFFKKSSQRKAAFLAKLSNKLLGADAQGEADEFSQAKRERQGRGTHGQVG